MFKALLDNGVSKLGAFLISLVLVSTAFAYLHGAVGIGFGILAFSSMAIWYTTLVGQDAGLVDIPFAIGSLLFITGLHQGNNINAGGGIVRYYTSLLSASQTGGFFSIATAGKVVVLADVVLFLMALVGVYLVVTQGREAFREQ